MQDLSELAQAEEAERQRQQEQQKLQQEQEILQQEQLQQEQLQQEEEQQQRAAEERALLDRVVKAQTRLRDLVTHVVTGIKSVRLQPSGAIDSVSAPAAERRDRFCQCACS